MNIQNYINGQLQDPVSGQWIDNYNPSVGAIYGRIPNSNKDDIDAAVRAAENAFPQWANTTIEERSRILIKIADLIEEKIEDLAKAESKDNGKPISLAGKIDIPRASA